MLRKTEPRDLEAIYRMLCDLEEVMLPREAFREVFLLNINSADSLYLVEEDASGELTGHFALHTQWLLHHAGRVAEVQEMYVVPAARGNGIGEKMLQEGIRWAREKGCVLIEVTANLKRERTHGFYMRHGFRHTHLKLTMSLS